MIPVATYPNEIYRNQRMQKWSEWNHKRQWEQRKMGENNTRGRIPRTSENMSKKVRQNGRENAWERKWQREREKSVKKQRAQEWKWGREAKSVRVKTVWGSIKIKGYYVSYHSITDIIGYNVGFEGQPTLYLNLKFKIWEF